MFSVFDMKKKRIERKDYLVLHFFSFNLGNLQFLFDWSYLKRPIMRQIILQSSSSSFTFTTINDFQLLVECIIENFYKKNLNENSKNHLKNLTFKIHKFISNLNNIDKQKPLFELFTLY